MELRVLQADTTAQVHSTETVAVPEPSALALRYHQSGHVLWVASTVLSLLIPGLLLFTGASARLRRLAQRIGGRWLLMVAVYALLFTLITALLSLPLAYYEGYLRQHEYGLSNQSLDRWLGEWLKGVALGGAGLALVLWIPYLLLRRSPKRWWLYSGMVTIPLATLMLVIAPIWVDPLFNDFGPMKDKALEARVLALAQQAGIEGGRVYQVDKSVDTKTVNAYVTGLGRTKRIVFWDTILARLEPDQVLFVAAHEMGHFVLGHTLAFILGAAALVTVSLYVVHRVAGSLIARFSRRFGFDQLSDVASFPLLLFLGSIVSLVMVPALLALSRYQEHEADRFALELTRDNRTAASTFVRLQEENLSVPRPGRFYMLFRGSHPALGDRIDFANGYRPWETGDRLRYERLIRLAN